jgi:hypothetical protein
MPCHDSEDSRSFEHSLFVRGAAHRLQAGVAGASRRRPPSAWTLLQRRSACCSAARRRSTRTQPQHATNDWGCRGLSRTRIWRQPHARPQVRRHCACARRRSAHQQPSAVDWAGALRQPCDRRCGPAALRRRRPLAHGCAVSGCVALWRRRRQRPSSISGGLTLRRRRRQRPSSVTGGLTLRWQHRPPSRPCAFANGLTLRRRGAYAPRPTRPGAGRVPQAWAAVAGSRRQTRSFGAGVGRSDPHCAAANGRSCQAASRARQWLHRCAGRWSQRLGLWRWWCSGHAEEARHRGCAVAIWSAADLWRQRRVRSGARGPAPEPDAAATKLHGTSGRRQFCLQDAVLPESVIEKSRIGDSKCGHRPSSSSS